VTTRRATDLDVPGYPPAPVPANVLDFFAPPRLPFAIPPLAVLAIALMQQQRATEKAVARHKRRTRRSNRQNKPDDGTT